MTLLWMMDCLVIGGAVTFVVCAAWVAICAILLSFHSWYTHVVETNHRLMHRFAETTNYPMYQRYQERTIVAARRRQRIEKLLNIVTFC